MADNEQPLGSDIEINGNVGPGAAVGHGASVNARIIAGGNINFNVPLPIPPELPLHLIVREKELLELRQLLSQNIDVPIVTMTGLPGIGKTTLATVAANYMAYVFRDGCLWTNMVEYTGKPVALLKRYIAHYSQEAPNLNEPDALVELLRSILANKRVLIVLDHVTDTNDLKYVKKLASGGLSNLLVITSSEVVAQQMQSPIYELTNLTDIDALRLLEELSHYHFDVADESFVKLLRYSRKHPATLAQIAVQMRDQPDKNLAEWAELLAGIPLAGVHTESLATAVYSLTYELLSQEQQRLWRLLGILGQAAYHPKALATILNLSEAEIQAHLAVLADVLFIRADADHRYRIQPLPYAFAQTTVQTSADFADLWQKAHAYYLQWFTRFTKVEQLQELEDELKHMRFLYSQAIERHDWQIIKLYRDRFSLSPRLGRVDISIQGSGLVYHYESVMPFPTFNLNVEEGTIARINLQGGSGKEMYCAGGMFSHLQLDGASLRDIDLQGCMFANSDLRGAELRDINVAGSTFINCDLRGAKLRDIHVTDGVFANCDLRGAALRDIHVYAGVFANCDLEEADLGNFFLMNAKATAINVSGARLGMIHLDSQSVLTEIQWQGAQLGGIEVDGTLTSPDELPCGIELLTGHSEGREENNNESGR